MCRRRACRVYISLQFLPCEMRGSPFLSFPSLRHFPFSRSTFAHERKREKKENIGNAGDGPSGPCFAGAEISVQMLRNYVSGERIWVIRKGKESAVTADMPMRGMQKMDVDFQISRNTRRQLPQLAIVKMVDAYFPPGQSSSNVNVHHGFSPKFVKTANARSSSSQSAPSRPPSRCLASDVADGSPASPPAVLPFPT